MSNKKKVFSTNLTTTTLQAIWEVERVVRWQWFAWNLRWKQLEIWIEEDPMPPFDYRRKVERITYVKGTLTATRLIRFRDPRKKIYVFAMITEQRQPITDRLPDFRIHTHLYAGEEVVPPKDGDRHQHWEMRYGDSPLSRWL